MKIKKDFFLENKWKIAIFLLFLFVLVYFAPGIFRSEPKVVYKVAVMAKDQKDKSLREEDLAISMKKGDVIVVQPENHSFSKTERISNLIIKMELTEEQKVKLMQAKTEGAEDDQKTILVRKYYIDLNNKAFEGFNHLDLLSDKPLYGDVVFDWSVVKKK